MAVHIDDMGLIGPLGTEAATDAMGDEVTLWLSRAWVSVKSLTKDTCRQAATTQLMLGFVWSSVALTRTLEETKLSSCLKQILHFAESRSMSLRDLQKLAGRVQRAVITLPPGAGCLLANPFAFMRALSLPYHMR
eukprot:6198193-Pleurochrysis_carterae.AAC.1